jgi:predicted enzyme related to lactoylglutathione lyase
MSDNHPTLGNGKICYIEIPAANIQVSSTFYQKTFGWKLRQRGDGATAFDDAVGEVSGTWVLGRKPMTEVSLLFYIMVDNMHVTVDAVIANGGKIVEPVGTHGKEIVSWISDPAGNIIGLYQQPG